MTRLRFKTLTRDSDLGHYLAGIIAGPGHFSKNQMVLSAHVKHRALMVVLQQRLGCGTIKPHGVNGLRYVVGNCPGLSRVLKLTNGKWVGPHKRDQLWNHGLDKTHGITWMLLQKQSLHSFWHAGFTDAHGCFNIYVWNSFKAGCGQRVALRLAWSQKDAILLRAIQPALALPSVYHCALPTHTPIFGLIYPVLNTWLKPIISLTFIRPRVWTMPHRGFGHGVAKWALLKSTLRLTGAIKYKNSRTHPAVSLKDHV